MPETTLCRAATVTTCYYKVYIRTDTSSLKHDQETLPIIPGMTAQVDIQTGEHSIVNYLLKPLMKARLY
ncbi:hypothetical protein [Chromohalobacter israelensis]|uniref:hypothetical protein n=1 Tax=Chromohalobacter israelensis TaxID=141390 RepID=UPI00265C0991|nr:hypothetical protein [Chromohalobacter salexigens]MDO0944951.1 hypothetical protein [Chromohalobacter salexigens]